MTARDVVSDATVAITIELFGTARIKAGVGAIPLRIDTGASMVQLAEELARECPALVGNALTDYGTIADGYALNRNGLEFLPPDNGAPLNLRTGDTLLLLSNQAGG
jgi:hypothetical protein